jgi:hypothetical protein
MAQAIRRCEIVVKSTALYLRPSSASCVSTKATDSCVHSNGNQCVQGIYTSIRHM